MRVPMVLAAVVLVAGCEKGGKGDCAPEDEVEAFEDLDGDGYGTTSVGKVCQLRGDQADEDGDCDDADVTVHPAAEERCNGVDDNCDLQLDEGFDAQKPFYADTDQDGFGDPNDVLVACQSPAGYVADDTDCDDTDGAVHPGLTEVCNGGVDDDCSGAADDEDPAVDPATLGEWHPDADGDGYGRADSSPVLQCDTPKGAVDNAEDCDDTNLDVNPDGAEVCNGDDDDCDGLFDDFDPDVDPSALVTVFADTDGDGAGDPYALVAVCQPRAGVGVENDLDCDDTNAEVNPGEQEVLCDVVDNDCDPASPDDLDRDLDTFFTCVDDCNDLNGNIHPAAVETPADGVDSNCDMLEDCYLDTDYDGSRTTTTVAVADGNCTMAGHLPPSAPVDCDDGDPGVTWSGDWLADTDLDGFGVGAVVLQQCTDPGAGYVLDGGTVDCDDGDPAVYPGAPDDTCNDGIDGDCDGLDSCATCKGWRDSDGALASGVYAIRPDGGTEVDVWCDLETDGGGWTLVTSTLTTTPNDQAVLYHADLATLDPTGPHAGLWDGLRDVVAGNTDVRFACKLLATDTAMTVDLSFYDVPWYLDVTAGSDAVSCFSDAADPIDPAPARRDNLAGTFLPLGDAYDGGDLVGEDTCNDTSDFTVDFDDRGMDSDESDGTDWGESDGKPKCGTSNTGEAWFVFVREP